MAIGTQFWDKVVSYPDFSSGRPGVTAIPVDLAPKNTGGYAIADANATIPVASTTTPFNTYKATFNGSMSFNTGSAIYDAFIADKWTYEAWVFPTNTPAAAYVLFGGGNNQFAITLHSSLGIYLTFLDVTAILLSSANSVPLNTWTKVAVTYDMTTIKIYINNTLNASTTVTIPFRATGLYQHGRSWLSTYGFVGALAEILITGATKTTFTSLSASYPRYAAQITGTITESLAITSWTITGVSATGLVCSTITTGSTYTLNCPSIELYTITCAPTVDSVWKASTAISLNYLVCPTNPDTNPVIYKCTTAGTTSGTEPTFTAATHTDGSVVWTKVADLVDPISLGTRIPS